MTRDAELRTAAHLARLAMILWRRGLDELAAAADETVPVDRAATFYFTMSSIAHSWRLGHAGESAERVQETFERYSIARFVNAFSFPPGTADATVRHSFMQTYRRVSPTYLQQLDKILEHWTTDGAHLLELWALQLTTVLFQEPFPLDADVERTRRVVKAIVEMWATSFQDVPRIELAAVTVPAEALWNLAVDAPDGWLANAGTPYEYYDPGRPEYRVWVTAAPSLDGDDGSDLEIVGQDLIGMPGSASGACVRLGADRALASYRTSADASGLAKDDRHWWLLERDGRCLRRVLFTLSVLAAHAEPTATDELAEQWSERIRAARFVVRH